MACAKKCDRCGKLYEQYNSKNDRKNPNGIMVLNLDSQRRYFAHNVLDLCPDCMKGFQDWFGEVKQMERLTLEEAIKYIKEVVCKNRKNKEKNTIVIPNSFISSADCAEKYEQVAKWLKELKSYKEAEEHGLLMKLPVPLGTTVYTLSTIFDCIYDYDCKSYQKWKCKEDIPCEYEKRSYHIKETEFGFVMAHSIGETVFLTREEAEKKLEELKNEI